MRWCPLAPLALFSFSWACLFPDLSRLGGSDAALDVFDAPTTTFVRVITITNNATTLLPVGYTIGVAFPDADMQAAIAAGKMRSDFADVRVRTTSGERDRMIDDPPLARVIWFSLASGIAAGATDTSYAIAYGDPNASTPPANGSAIFDFYDDFSETTLDSRWVVANDITPSNGTITLRSNASDAMTTMSPLPSQTTLELSAQVSNPSSTDGGDSSDYSYWLGFQRSGDLDADAPWALWLCDDTATISPTQQTDGCSNLCSAPSVAQTTAFRIYGIERQPTASIFSIDGAVSATLDQAINDQAMSIMMRSFLVASDISIDWVRAHAQVYPVPTVTLGAEQTP